MHLLNILLTLSLALALAPLRPANAAYTPPPPEAPAAIDEAAGAGAMPLAPAFSGCGGQLVVAVDAAYEQQVVELVNSTRQQNGLPPLKRVDLLDQAARYHAADMAQDGYFKHDTYDPGKQDAVCSWIERIASFYVPPGGPSYSALAENIAGGQSDPAAVMNAWMNSSGHRANILSSSNWELGVGYYTGGPYRHYWVQDFGRRRGVYPLVINGDAASSASRTVALYIYGQGVFTEMRLRNDDGVWGSWQPFQPSLDWELSCGVGAHTVSVELRSAALAASSSDSIDLSQNDCTPNLGNLPDGLYFAYSIADQALFPRQIELQPLNTGSPQSISWTVSAQGDWFSVQPLSGVTPETLIVTPGNFDIQIPGAYTGTLTVTATGLSGVAGSPHRIDLHLLVFEDPAHSAYLPYLTR